MLDPLLLGIYEQNNLKVAMEVHLIFKMLYAMRNVQHAIFSIFTALEMRVHCRRSLMFSCSYRIRCSHPNKRYDRLVLQHLPTFPLLLPVSGRSAYTPGSHVRLQGLSPLRTCLRLSRDLNLSPSYPLVW